MPDSPKRRVLLTREVAAIFRVDPKTVTRWANAGKLTSWRTVGGHRRFWADEIVAYVRAGHHPATDPPPPAAATQTSEQA